MTKLFMTQVIKMMIRIILLQMVLSISLAFTNYNNKIYHNNNILSGRPMVYKHESSIKTKGIVHKQRIYMTATTNTNGYQNRIDTGKNSKQQENIHNYRIRKTGNRILSPNNILYPSYFPYRNDDDNIQQGEENDQNPNTTQIEKLTLYKALNQLRKTMKKLIQFESKLDMTSDDEIVRRQNIEKLEFILGSNKVNGDTHIFSVTSEDNDGDFNDSDTMNDSTNGFNNQKTNSHQYFTIRVEQPLSHSVDPLCWLHANAKKSTLSSLKHNKDDSDDPVIIYLANAEKTMETGIYGSSLTIRNLNGSIKDDDVHSGDFSPWDLINNLPMGSRLYGGGRFDEDLNTELKGGEWEAFGKEMWILPAIELRREKTSIDGTIDNTTELLPNSQNKVQVDETMKENNTNYHQRNEFLEYSNFMETTLSINLHFKTASDLISSSKYVLMLLEKMSFKISPPFPDTNLPPILSRGYNDNAQEVFENGVNAALEEFRSGDTDSIQKVVLARRNDLHFGTKVSGLDVMMKVKFGGNVGGHLFYINPGNDAGKEFLGCAPERLFQVRTMDKKVISEALAGTRPRGSTSEEDAELLQDLLSSEKDRIENIITANFIRDAFNQLRDKNFLCDDKAQNTLPDNDMFFIRRLRHLQHLCQSFEGNLREDNCAIDVVRLLLNKLHPTPAVCGYPMSSSLEFIREHETINFDRGMYSGPFGFIGRDYTDIIVAIRSGLLTSNRDKHQSSTLSIYAGAGIVPGSSVQGEWSETGYKLGVLSSFFAQSPIVLKSFPTANEAWATSFVEELIRSGITQYYICPGSRSTPLTTALARAMRMHVGVIDCVSVHDERSAAFRALGYGRSTGRTAAVITSSGTAVANLYPAVIESSMDGIPMLLLTADRPYENRDVGANQSIDQLKIFSERYIRWFRDIAPPSDDVPVSMALSDANHAAKMTQVLLGPVHLNIQFRENLAPESGPIRGDDRKGSMTKFSSSRFTDVPGFERWSIHGRKWASSYGFEMPDDIASKEVANLIAQSKRGIIVLGNIRDRNTKGGSSDSMTITALIAEFASHIGFPVLAGAQSADIRFQSTSVIPYAEYLLKHPEIKQNLKPDLIIQIGSSLVSTEIQGIISQSMKEENGIAHVLIHSHSPAERIDPYGTVTNVVSSYVQSFIPKVTQILENEGFSEGTIGSSLIPLIRLGQEVGKVIPSIIHEATSNVISKKTRVWENATCDKVDYLSEPQITLALTEILCDPQNNLIQDFFISNSMPVRDTELFLYPTNSYVQTKHEKMCLSSVSVNRGASGIDGIISTSTGYVEGTLSPTTLVIGDLATLHDINAFYHLSNRSNRNSLPLTTIVINNDGGGIFSFLPIAKFGNDVGFEEFFGTPTNTFSFEKGADAFGLPFKRVCTFQDFKDVYKQMRKEMKPTIIEAEVLGRDENVQIHKEITSMVMNTIDEILSDNITLKSFHHDLRLVSKSFRNDEWESIRDDKQESKTLVLLHGWMGDKNEWDEVAMSLMEDLKENWNIVSVDLPGHGENKSICDWPRQRIRKMLSLDSPLNDNDDQNVSIDVIAECVLSSLSKEYGINNVDALAGYSLGGRIALAMKKLCSMEKHPNVLVSDETQLIILGSYPGTVDTSASVLELEKERLDRKAKDSQLSMEIFRIYESTMGQASESIVSKPWMPFLKMWYGNKALWADMETRNPDAYQEMSQKRLKSLVLRAPDFAHILEICSPGSNADDYWKYISPKNTYYLFGELDQKYSTIGNQLDRKATVVEINNASHALLAESASEVATTISRILSRPLQASHLDDVKYTQTEKSSQQLKLNNERDDISPLAVNVILTYVKPGALDMELFAVEMSEGNDENGVNGIGWGDQALSSNKINERRGYIISIASDDGRYVGLGEVSPLVGVHPENVNDVKVQLKKIQDAFSKATDIAMMPCQKILALDGSLDTYVDLFISSLSVEDVQPSDIFASVRSGLEMSLLSLASDAVKTPLPRALMGSTTLSILPINGLVTRDSKQPRLKQGTNKSRDDIVYPSMKVKVGHRQPHVDARSVVETHLKHGSLRVRADANRAWDESSAITFTKELTNIDENFDQILEFVEEPIMRQLNQGSKWTLSNQVRALEKWHEKTGFMYALDESIAETVFATKDDGFDTFSDIIRNALSSSNGCAALILKPTVIGIELSMRLAKLVHEEFSGTGVVFTSAFESGVGLAFISFLATASDAIAQKGDQQFPHGISTFSLLKGDTLSPSFESYVKEDGTLKVAPLGRAIYGLSLDELRDYFYSMEEVDELEVNQPLERQDYKAKSSETGREINIQVSLPLPFSDNIACSRFTDLPQQPRWSPWLKSVSYLGKGETEWTLNVRGVEFRWRAISTYLESPKGIMWESTSGLKNKGRVEFIKISDNSCLMKLKMTIRTPRIIATVFKTTGEFVQEFVENKLLKWSLESFRDVVKADLALERGDAELGDALYGAVEGRTNAIEATLSNDGFDTMTL